MAQRNPVYCVTVCVHRLGRFSCLTLCDPLGCSPAASSVHEILQARTLEWVAMPSSRGSCSSYTDRWVPYHERHPRSPSLEPQMVKNPPAALETWVRFLGWEDPLGESVATLSSGLAWRIPRDRGSWWATVHGVAKTWV